MPTLRPYRTADEDELVGVWLASTIPGQAFLPETHWRAQEGAIRLLIPSAEIWVVDVDGVIVAFIALLGDLVGGLFTHPDHQGRGHAVSLIEQALLTHDPLYVEVYEENREAVRFYRNRGFADYEVGRDEETGLKLLILQLSRLSFA